jgi:hypothetical protein
MFRALKTLDASWNFKPSTVIGALRAVISKKKVGTCVAVLSELFCNNSLLFIEFLAGRSGMGLSSPIFGSRRALGSLYNPETESYVQTFLSSSFATPFLGSCCVLLAASFAVQLCFCMYDACDFSFYKAMRNGLPPKASGSRKAAKKDSCDTDRVFV